MKALIVDDEVHSSEITEMLVAENCPDILQIDRTNKPDEAVTMLKNMGYDILFLDIEMPGMNGFELLKKVDSPLPSVIFTTAYDQFALEAFRAHAIDYLVKPIVVEDLITAVQKAIRSRKSEKEQHLVELLQSTLGAPQLQKLAIGSMGGIDWVPYSKVIRCTSDSNYTTVVTEDGQHILSKTLKQVEEQLPDSIFMRVHASHVVNLNHINSYKRGAGGTLVMSNKENIPVSRQHKSELLRKMGA